MTPQIGDAEELQGFPRGWTHGRRIVSTRKGTRWKLVGNAVTVGVSRWVGERLWHPASRWRRSLRCRIGSKWPTAAYGSNGDAWAVDVSLWPKQMPYRHLADLVDLDDAPPLSARATAGFLNRAERSTTELRRRLHRRLDAARRSHVGGACRRLTIRSDPRRRPTSSGPHASAGSARHEAGDALRRALCARGLRYRLDRAPIPGMRRRADIVFGPAKVAVYVDGCFWHSCPEHATVPKNNREWWIEKLAGQRRGEIATPTASSAKPGGRSCGSGNTRKRPLPSSGWSGHWKEVGERLVDRQIGERPAPLLSPSARGAACPNTWFA